jgi:hypothetical protein
MQGHMTVCIHVSVNDPPAATPMVCYCHDTVAPLRCCCCRCCCAGPTAAVVLVLGTAPQGVTVMACARRRVTAAGTALAHVGQQGASQTLCKPLYCRQGLP